SCLTAMGFTVEHHIINNVSNLFAIRGTQKPTLCFAGHTDVVPAGDLSSWRTPPFTPTIEKNKLYARGAADMKSSIAAMIAACERFIHLYPEHPSSIAFLITSDEEGPALDGTQAILKILAARQQIPEWCLVGEPSSTVKLADTAKIGRRGSITGYLKIMGKQGHVAYPQLALNPIHQAFIPLAEIAAITWDQGTEFFPPSSLQFANIQAGTGAANVIPGILETNFNLRFSPQTSPEYIQATVEGILQKHGCEYHIDWILGGKPFYTSPENDFIRKVATTISVGVAPLGIAL
ncbi:MAG TPA: succinyl-diaminopimelate desuccinylase, partial [Candidatus Berkiella sp.]|nr:succinyl-diaminopimelate desuccinylase [Candidatus Berkiella sp.]